MLNLVTYLKFLPIIFIFVFCSIIQAEELIEADGVVVMTKKDMVKIEKSDNRNLKEETKLFNENIKKLVKVEENKILFMCVEQEYGYKKRFVMKTENGWTCDFILGLNEKFRGPLDNHGSTEYQLINIGTESVTIKYKSEFDHRSFGENKKTVDEGSVEVKYRE